MVVSAFWSPTVWRWLMDTGFAPKEAEQVASWVVDALVDALKRDPSGLADAPADKPPAKANRRERKR